MLRSLVGSEMCIRDRLHGADIGSFTLDTSNCTIKIWVYKNKISDVGIKFVDATAAAQPEIKVANTLINQWEELTFDFSSRIGMYPLLKDQIVVFPDFDLSGRTSDEIVLFDNITFSSGSSTTTSGCTDPTANNYNSSATCLLYTSPSPRDS